MASLEPKKLALLRIWQILLKHSDYDHPLTQEEIIKYLENDSDVISEYPVSDPPAPFESRMINEKYDFIEEVIAEVLVNRDEKSAMTDKIDRVLTHPIWGIPVFLGIMAVVFMLTFAVGDWLKGYLEIGLGFFSDSVDSLLIHLGAGELIRSLVVDGINVEVIKSSKQKKVFLLLYYYKT